MCVCAWKINWGWKRIGEAQHIEMNFMLNKVEMMIVLCLQSQNKNKKEPKPVKEMEKSKKKYVKRKKKHSIEQQ